MAKIESYGPLSEYHNRVGEARHVRVGDFVVAVNAVRGDPEKMMKALGAGGDMELEIRRAHQIKLEGLQGGSLGLDLSYRASNESVMIKGVSEDGEVSRWNGQQSI